MQKAADLDIENKLAVTGGEWWGMGQYGGRDLNTGYYGIICYDVYKAFENCEAL